MHLPKFVPAWKSLCDSFQRGKFAGTRSNLGSTSPSSLDNIS